MNNIDLTPPTFFSPQVSEARRFYLDLTPPRTVPLAVVCGGCEHCAPDYAVRRTDFPYLSLEYVARGHGALHLAGKRVALQPGVLFAYGPGVRHEIEAEPKDPPVKYFVDFCGTGGRTLLRVAGLFPGYATRVFPPNELQALFDELIRNGRKGARASGALCARLLECLALQIKAAAAPLAAAAGPAFQTYLRCRAHIQTHPSRLVSLAQIARECRLDAAYLCRLFRRYDHQSPYQYLMRLKMTAAAERLQQPGALVKTVAAEAGFADPFHFSRAFKAALGIAPAEFRRLR